MLVTIICNGGACLALVVKNGLCLSCAEQKRYHSRPHVQCGTCFALMTDDTINVANAHVANCSAVAAR